MLKRSHREALIGYTFLLPNIAGFLVFSLGPIFFTFLLSFFDWDLFARPIFVDAANYETMFRDETSHFWNFLGNSLFFLLVVPAQMALALLAAYLLNERLKGSLFFKLVFFVPVVLSLVPVAIIWEYLLDTDNGLLNLVLASFGVHKIAWLFDASWIKVGISLMVVWQGSAFSTIIYYAALQGIPDQLYEVATLDGASRWTQFSRITLPLLAPTHLFLMVTGIIGALQLFAPILVMTHGTAGGAHNLIVEIYWKAYHEFSMGYASALSWVLFLLVFLVSLVSWKVVGTRGSMGTDA